MHISVKVQMIKVSENPKFILNQFVGTDKILEGRLLCANSAYYQIKHPRYINWFTVPRELVKIVE